MKTQYRHLLAIGIIILPFPFFLLLSSPPAGQIMINEVCSNNFSLAPNETGEYTDYIELYNPGTEELSLEGYYLSDREAHLQKYSLSHIILPPEGYYVVWLDGLSGTARGQEGFRLSRQGETVYLSNGKGQVIDSVTIPPLPYNTCYGRLADGGAKWSVMAGTPGSTNTDAAPLPTVALADPVFSMESGFYDTPFQLTIKAPEGEVVYYTLDGSDPTPESERFPGSLEITDASLQENVYAARTDLSPTRSFVPSFLVDKATVVRAASYNKEKNIASQVVTKVYFVGFGQKKEYQDLPVISLVTDQDNLFHAERGIYGNGAALEQYKADGGLSDGKLLDSFVDTNGEQRFLYMASNAFNDGKEWEREASFTYFDESHGYCFTQNVGIQIAGQSTRATPKKSFSIYGRDIYDKEVVFPYQFFPDTSYSSIKLRNGGNNNDSVVITDAFLEELAQGRNVSTQGTSPCILFLNGEYWGIYNIRERYKEEYLRNHFGISEGNVWIVDSGSARVGGVQAQEAYENMLNMVMDCDLSYDDVYAMVCESVDVQSLIDYLCINLYINNMDVYLGANTAVWRSAEKEDRAYGDAKWRWMLFDLDVSLLPNDEDNPSWMEEYPLLAEPVVKSFLANEEFRKQFCLSFMDIANTTYAYGRVHEKLMDWKETYGPQTVKSHQRFFDEGFTLETFDSYIADIDHFFKNRFDFAMEGLAETFDLKGSLEPLAVRNNTPEGGYVTVNTATLDHGDWQGQYFTDYPISLTAIPKEGYRFAGWQGDAAGLDPSLKLTLPPGGIQLEAVFEKIQ